MNLPFVYDQIYLEEVKRVTFTPIGCEKKVIILH